MQRFLLFLLIFSLFSQAFVRTAWVLHYQWNYTTYLERCENKAKPSLHCNGKCHLKKQMIASEKQDPTKPVLPGSFHELKDIQLFFELPVLLPVFTAAYEEVSGLPLYHFFYPDAPADLVFRPPAC